jgi:hypothetical protein
MTTLSDVLAFLPAASLSDLDAIAVATQRARKTAAQQEVASLKEGDRVRLVNISPKRLAGMTGTIQRDPYNRSHGWAVKLDAPDPRHGSVIVPNAASIVKLPA